MNTKKLVSYTLCALLGFSFLLGGCNVENVYVKRVVLAKNQKHDKYKIAFTDGSDFDVTYGIYSLSDVGDTLMFNHLSGVEFNTWDNRFVKVIKQKKLNLTFGG